MKEIEAATGNTPKALADAPILHATEQELVTAYNVLALRRTRGFVPNPIQLSEIVAFIQIYGPPSIPIDTFVELIGMMDFKSLELQHGNKPSSNS